MLRRLKSTTPKAGGDREHQEAASGGNAPGSPTNAVTSSANGISVAEQMSSLQRYRSQTMKDYGLMIEYRHLRQNVPAGIYVLPSYSAPRIWYGVIFIHQGFYRNGIFRFKVVLPDGYNGPGTYPRVFFNTSIVHPFVDPETRELDLKPRFPDWNPDVHYMVVVLAYIKSIFYTHDFTQSVENVVNPMALDMFRRDLPNYLIAVENSVVVSLENLYQNEPDSPIRFTKPTPAHESLQRELFARLETAATGSTTSTPASNISTGNSSTIPGSTSAASSSNPPASSTAAVADHPQTNSALPQTD